MADSPRIEELKRRVQVDPASIAFAALAEEYRRAGRFEEAIATCQAGLQRHPAYLSAHVTLGRALLELGRFDEARQELEHVLRAAPENLAAIRGLAEIHHRRGELPEALEQYRSALQVAKHDAEIEEAVEKISKQVASVCAAAPSTAAADAPEPHVDPAAQSTLEPLKWPVLSVDPRQPAPFVPAASGPAAFDKAFEAAAFDEAFEAAPAPEPLAPFSTPAMPQPAALLPTEPLAVAQPEPLPADEPEEPADEPAPLHADGPELVLLHDAEPLTTQADAVIARESDEAFVIEMDLPVEEPVDTLLAEALEQPAPDRTLSALEDFLAAILRAKNGRISAPTVLR